jgi:hypothetical protein
MSSFVMLMTGWVLDLRRHTITEVVRAAGVVGVKHISSFHRFFSRGRWATDEVGMVLVALILEKLAPSGVVRLIVGAWMRPCMPLLRSDAGAQMGRTHVRGARVASPKARAKRSNAPWKRLTVNVYGRKATVRVLVID